MRDRMSLLEPDSYSLQIAFRDDSSERSQEVANALAEVLQTDVLARADIAPPVPVAPRNHRRHSPDSAHVATPADETRRQLARVDAQFLQLTQRQSELEEKAADRCCRHAKHDSKNCRGRASG
jgi:hypothetical protein